MKFTRRRFLQASALGSAAVMAPNLAFSAGVTNKRIVLISLRGAQCPLNTVVPYGNTDYYAARPTISIPKAGQVGGALDLDGYYGFHPGMAPLLPLYKTTKNLAVAYGTGLRDMNNRSHFASQVFADRGDYAVTSDATGFLNRHMTVVNASGTFYGVGFGKGLPYSLHGPKPAVGMESIAHFTLTTTSKRKVAMQDEWDGFYANDATLGSSFLESRSAVDELVVYHPATYAVENGAVYPDSPLGADLAEVAQMIKAGTGATILVVEKGEWDMHDKMDGGDDPEMPDMLDDLASAMVAFNTDMGTTRMKDTIVLTMTEFGRRIGENASRGADHGTGSLMLLMGGSVNGGKIYGSRPDLSRWDENEFEDLAVTVDFRNVLSEMLQKCCGNTNLAFTFPGYAQEPFLGIFKST